VAFTIGPTLGGVLQTWLGWRSVFYATIPVGLICVALAYLIIDDPPRDEPAKRRPIDLAGASLLGLGLTGLMLALTRGFDGEGSATAFRWLALPALVALVAFVRVELTVSDPTIDLGLFRNRVFAGSNAAKVFSYTAMSSVTFLLPFFFQRALGYSPALTGVAMTAFPIALAAGSMIGGPLSDRVGSHLLQPAGMLVASLGGFTLTRVAPSTGYIPVMIAMLLVGLGMGLFIVPNDSAIMGAAPHDKLGVSSGILATTRNLGLSSGVAFAGTLLAIRSQSYALTIPSPALSFSLAFNDVYLVTICFCLVALVLSLFRGKAGHG
jgi:predicted MFS family arabinose efflux permease